MLAGRRKFRLFSAAVLVFLAGCRLERREDFDFSPTQPMRCGILKSYYFVREIQEEVYPDLGLVVANAAKLALSEGQKSELSAQARHCTELCEVRKDRLRLMQEEIKRRLALNEIKGDLKLLAKEVRDFEKAKTEWLSEHARRYRAGLALLDESQRAGWAMAEKNLKPFPPSESP